MGDIRELPDICSVRVEGKPYSSTDFVAVLADETGDAAVLYNTDAMTLGMALKLISKEFIECLSQCTEEERREVRAILGYPFREDDNEQD